MPFERPLRALACGICLSVFAASGSAQSIPGCVMPIGYERAQPPRASAAQNELLDGPRILIDSLRRGFEDGKPRSCSNAGVITLVIDPNDVSPTDVYSFEVASGRLPDGLLPSGYVEPIDIGSGRQGFRFTWLDLAPGDATLASIDAVIRINRISFAGERSEPMLLPIIDVGGAPASTSRLWNSTFVWIAVALVLLVYVGMRMKLFRRPGRRSDELAAIQTRLRELAADKTASRTDESD